MAEPRDQLFWVRFRNPEHPRELACYTLASSSLAIRLFFPWGEIEECLFIQPRAPIEAYKPFDLTAYRRQQIAQQQQQQERKEQS